MKLTDFVENELNKGKKDGWRVVKLGELLELIRNGLSKKQTEKGKYPVTRIETISNEIIDENRLGYIDDVTEEELRKYRLIEGDILFSHINSAEHLGKVAIYEGKPPLLLHGVNLLLLRPKKSLINPYFLLYALKYLRAKGIFVYIGKRAVNQVSLNQNDLKKLEIPLLPLEEQKRIVEYLDSVFEKIKKAEEYHKKALENVDQLWESVLNKIFSNPEEKGWRIVKLKDVVLPTECIDPTKTPDKEFKYVDITNVSNTT